MEDSINENPSSSLLGESDSAAKELDKLRSAVMDRDGLIAGVFELLRRVPRRLLMILKLSDLQRSLDYSLSTTHSAHRIYIIIGQFCTQAVWDADRTRIGREYGQMGLSLPLIREIVGAWWSYASNTVFFGVLGWGMDVDARWRKMTLWLHGLTHGGLNTASLEVAGLKA
jgi:aarF domain-containing kinase